MSNYQENEEQKDFPEFDRVYKRFNDLGFLKPQIQTKVYEAISRRWCVGKAVLDAGCGIGIGTNVLGWDAVGAWGIDQNLQNIKVAQQLYESPRVKFEALDLVAPPSRPLATFDIVVCLEVIEHIGDYQKALDTLKRFGDRKRNTIFFISSPNRANPALSGNKPKNLLHVREWTAGEFYGVMTKNFESVVMYAAEKINNFSLDETVDGGTELTPIVAKCELPI